jgi:2-polyprenyl-3-methyl-5-hydroxy-6-metoxy-1,4-benzoquinol methylase
VGGGIRLIPSSYDDTYFKTSKPVSHEKISLIFNTFGLEEPSGFQVLDLGAGKGLSPQYFSSHKNDVLAADISTQALEWQKQFCGPNLKTLAFDFLSPWPLESNTFDIVFCNEVIEHFAPSSVFFSEANRVLKPQGMVIFKTPNRWDANRLLCFLKKITWYGDLDPTHVYFYSPFSLRQSLKQAKFIDVQIKTGITPLSQQFILKYLKIPFCGPGLIGLGMKSA